MNTVNSGEIYRFFTKPWNDLELRLAIRGVLEKHDMERENPRLLATVRRQSGELRTLERRYPGISELRREPDGTYRLEEEMSDEDIVRIIARCNDL